MSLGTWIYLPKRRDRSWISSRRRHTNLSEFYYRKRRRRLDNDRLYGITLGFLALGMFLEIGFTSVHPIRDTEFLGSARTEFHRVERPGKLADTRIIIPYNCRYLTITKDGTVRIHGDENSPENWEKYFGTHEYQWRRPIPILLIDREAKMGVVLDQIAILRERGFETMVFSTKTDWDQLEKLPYWHPRYESYIESLQTKESN